MVKCVLVTGTPGCGKTRFSKALAKHLGWSYVDGKKIIKTLPTVYDRARKCDVVDENVFASAAEAHIKKHGGKVVLDSHLSHFVDPKMARACIAVTCPRDKLHARLKKRGYSGEKIAENMECEIMEVCSAEAQAHHHKVIEVVGVGSPDLDALQRRLRIK